MERSRKETLGEDTASTACTSLHMCYFQLDGEQAKFSNRLSLELKSSSPPPPPPPHAQHPLPAGTRSPSAPRAPRSAPFGLCSHRRDARTLRTRSQRLLPLLKPLLVARPQDLTLLGVGSGSSFFPSQFRLVQRPAPASSQTRPHSDRDLEHLLPLASHTHAHSHLLSLCFFLSSGKISLLPPLPKSPLLPPPLSPITATPPEVQLLLQPCPRPA